MTAEPSEPTPATNRSGQPSPGASILLVDDSPANLHALIAALRGQYNILLATSGEQALDIAGRVVPDLILLDVMMPGTDGYQVCRQLKQQTRTRDIPVIFVTGKTDEQDEMAGFELGAVDYITKPFSLPLVQRRVQTHLELKYHRDQLRRQSHEDGLTAVANRRRFDEELEACWHSAQHAQWLSLILSDVDFFKKYNDGYGHQAGDCCLQQVAAAMRSVVLPAGALLARYGGEEFVVLLPGIDGTEAMRYAEQLRLAVAALQREHRFSTAGPVVSLSLGVATCQPAGGQLTQAKQLIEQADQALYQAKSQGRNSVCFFNA
jgi:diguanylate cyclase (GGDEF)-like protein